MYRYKMVNGERIQFTPEEEALRDAEEAAWAAEQAQRNQLRQAIAPLEAAFEAMPKGKQSLLKGLRADVRAALEAGDIAEAREILETAPTDLYGEAKADRDTFLSLLPQS